MLSVKRRKGPKLKINKTIHSQLQYRRQQSRRAHRQFEEKGFLGVVLHGHRAAARKIIRQHVRDLFDEAEIIIENRDFKIQPERAVVQIGRAHGGVRRIN